MKKALLLPLLFFVFSCIYSQSTWTYNFSDTTENKDLVYTDSILDPQQLWSIHLDTLTGQRWLAFEADSSMHKDSIRASCIVNAKYSDIFYSQLIINHQYNFSGAKNAGYAEDFPYWSTTTWRKIGKYNPNLQFPPDDWESGGPMNDSSEFRNYDSISSSKRHHCALTFKTDGSMPGDGNIKFTVYDYDTTPHHSYWKIFSLKTVYIPNYQCGTGINEIETRSLQIAPNPSTGKFNIIQQDGFVLSRNASLSIIDISGREVGQQADLSASSEIDISKLGAGIYTVIVHDAERNNSWRTRIVKE